MQHASVLRKCKNQMRVFANQLLIIRHLGVHVSIYAPVPSDMPEASKPRCESHPSRRGFQHNPLLLTYT